MLVPLKIPPGIYGNGTEYQGAGRWITASLVRWHEGSMGPVGGWQTREVSANVDYGGGDFGEGDYGATAGDAVLSLEEPPRAALSWSDLSGLSHFAIGTATELLAITEAGITTGITPTDLTEGIADADDNTGFGGGYFGREAYGDQRQDAGSYVEATTWALDNWGEYLLACSNADGVIYQWTLEGIAEPLPNAPVDNLSMMVTAERFVFALGAGGNPRLVAWSDRENNAVWAPLATNEAGDLELQTNGQIMCGIRVKGQSLILTDIDAHVATYQGPPYVYGFQRVGTSCGAVSRKAVAALDSGAFWMGSRGFFAFAGDAVQEIACEVFDLVFNDINAVQQSKVYAVANAQYNEVWWFYPADDDLENSRYVTYSVRGNHWSMGVVSRTAGFDRGVFRNPIWFAADGTAYDHEIGFGHDGSPVFAESGPMQLGNGDQVYMSTSLIPDERTQGDLTATFKTKFHPNATEADHGPYSMANPVSVRFTGRQVRMRVDAARDTDWRLGVPRLEVRPGGLR